MDEENNKEIVVSDSSSNEGRPSLKKQKLSTGEISSTSIKIDGLQYTNRKLEEYVQKLEAEKRQHIDGCNQEKILELEDTVAKLQTIIAKNKEEKNQHKFDMDFVKNEYETKITNEKRESRAKILELNNKIALLETIKPEPKDSDEDEHEALQKEKDTLHSEVIELKNKIEILEDEKKQFESKIQELADEISSMKNIKIEIKNSVEKEKETLRAEKDELNAEINELKKQVGLLEQKNQNFIEMHAKEVKNLKKQKDAAEKKFKESLQSEQKLKEEKKKLLTAADKEIKQLKTQNSTLEENIEEIRKQLSESEKRNKKSEKKLSETVAANQQLETKIDGLEADKQNLSKTNMDFMNNEKELQNSINELKNKVEKMEKDESETKILSLEEIFNESKLNESFFSCKSNIVVNLTKLEKKYNGWNLYSTTNESKNPRFLTEKEIVSNCFSMNVNGQLVINDDYEHTFNQIMHKINSCALIKRFNKVKNNKKFEKYGLKYTTIANNSKKLFFMSRMENYRNPYNKILVFQEASLHEATNRHHKFKSKDETSEECGIDEILTYLPNITNFKYEYYELKKDHSLIAKNLGQLEPFSDLQKFEITNLSQSFKVEDLQKFLKKNNKDVCYTFTFSGKTSKNKQKETEAAKNELLKSLLFRCKIRLGFKGETRLCPTVWV